MGLLFVDCEAFGPVPRMGRLTEFGAVDYSTRKTFHGVILPSWPSKENPAIPDVSPEHRFLSDEAYYALARPVFERFDDWIVEVLPKKDRPIMVTDNPAYDFMWVADGFWMTLGRNPFGHSARRIGDFYAGLVGDFYASQRWKNMRITKHDHNPVNDSMGNVEAFDGMKAGRRA